MDVSGRGVVRLARVGVRGTDKGAWALCGFSLSNLQFRDASPPPRACRFHLAVS